MSSHTHKAKYTIIYKVSCSFSLPPHLPLSSSLPPVPSPSRTLSLPYPYPPQVAHSPAAVRDGSTEATSAPQRGAAAVAETRRVLRVGAGGDSNGIPNILVPRRRGRGPGGGTMAVDGQQKLIGLARVVKCW